MVTEVRRASCQHGLVGSEGLALDVDDDVTQLPLQPQLVQLRQDSVPELRHIKLDVAAVVHLLNTLLQFAGGLRRKRKTSAQRQRNLSTELI